MIWEGLNPPYRTIVADPPWRPAWSNRQKAGPGRRYSTMTTVDICSLPIAELADESAHVWVWGINAMLDDAYEVVRSWGFTPMTALTWCKPAPGVGQYLRTNTEHAVLGTRGTPLVPIPSLRPVSWFVASRGAHSAKPGAFYDLVERISPPPYLDLFTRQTRMGWDSWGWGYEEVGA